MTDCRTGRAILLPQTVTYDRATEATLTYLAAMTEGGLIFRPDGYLLIIQGCDSDQACGTYYYTLRDRKFKLLRLIHVCRDDYGESENDCGPIYYKHVDDRWVVKKRAASK